MGFQGGFPAPLPIIENASPHAQACASPAPVKKESIVAEHTIPVLSQTAYPFDARGVAKRFRHAAIFGALSALQPGETMRFCNDHDPLPLLQQLQGYFGDDVRIEYISREPGEIVIDFHVVSDSRA
ncbi:DUF2249 domain-containing protein [Parapusillimonas granuli]|uniref:DUF2249 domain-containing protein n=1 Tax=Parapusillimonas granuli TaxID=380911 RepID=A0A853G2C6_9BURK|nr:DUF2249 domain-containing protein [Parapusillimonas granuli]